MTTKDIAQAVGKTERGVRNWVSKLAEKNDAVAEKASASSPMRPADYTEDEVLAIIEVGMGNSVYALAKANMEAFEQLRSDDSFKTKEGFVYLARDSSSNYTKIGITTNIASRSSNMRVSNPFVEIVAAAYSEHPRDLEKALHKIHAAKWVCGEWFDLSQQDIDAVVRSHKMKRQIEGVKA